MSAYREDPWDSSPATAGILVGRDEERQVLERFTRRVRDGLSGALVLEGEIGAGKTRLLDLAATMAADLRVVRVSGVEPEAALGFAALHRLAGPFLDRLEQVPGPQRDALRVAFGLISGGPVDRFLSGLATLGVLAGVAAERPVVCLVDDAQWLDRESAEVLAFVARRLRDEGVGVILARRAAAGGDLFEGVPVRTVRGLGVAEAHRLLGSVVQGPLDDGVARRLAAETDGNPLALVTLAAGLSAGQLAGHSPLPSPLPLGAQLETYLLTKIRALPLATQALLLVASISPPQDQGLLWRAASSFGLSPVDADPAVAEGILRLGDMLGGSVAFLHPLTRSAVYGAAHPSDRRRAHEAVSAASDPVADADTRAWHLAAATAGTDEDAARGLEAAAERARARGGYTSQGTFLARAAELSPDPGVGRGRMIAAGHAFLVAGDIAAARRLLERVGEGHLPVVLRARAQRLRAAVDFAVERPARVPAVLLDAVGAVDGEPARVMLREALTAAVVAGRYTSGTTLEAVARAALAVQPADLVVRAVATRVCDGYLASVPLLRDALGAEPQAVLGGLLAEEVWDEEGRHAYLTRLAGVERDNGALGALKLTLAGLADGEVWAGRFHVARAHHEEIATLDAMTGTAATGLTTRIELLAWQGAEAEAREVAATLTEVVGKEQGVAVAADHAALAMTVLELSLGNYRDAYDQAASLHPETRNRG